MHIQFRNLFIHSHWFILSILVLIAPALINGYPLVYSDTGTYIAHGFSGRIPFDRPIMYCFFVRHISLSASLWLVIVLQAILLWLVINLLCRHFLNFRNHHLACFFIILFLSCTTGIANYTSQIMADVFSPIAILSTALLLALPSLDRFYKIALSILIVFSNMAHSSNLLVSTLILVLTAFPLLLLRKKFQQALSRLRYLAYLVAASWLLVPLTNYLSGSGFVVSRAPNVFLMGRLSESGILKNYLDETCSIHPIPLCEYTNALPEKSWEFLWSSNSPLYKGGCVPRNGQTMECWLVKNQEYASIVHDVFSDAHYTLLYLGFAAKESCAQLLHYETEPLVPMMEGSPVLENIAWRFKSEYNQYIHSRQASEPFTYENINRIQSILLGVSLPAFLILLLVKIRNTNHNLLLLFFIIVAGLIMNAVVCASFSMIADRFQGRIIWLLPLITILLVLQKKQKISAQ